MVLSPVDAGVTVPHSLSVVLEASTTYRLGLGDGCPHGSGTLGAMYVDDLWELE